MRNILSYEENIHFTGKEIKDWIVFQIANQTSHLNQALYMQRFMKVKDDRKYIIRIQNHYEHHQTRLTRKPRVYRIA